MVVIPSFTKIQLNLLFQDKIPITSVAASGAFSSPHDSVD